MLLFYEAPPLISISFKIVLGVYLFCIAPANVSCDEKNLYFLKALSPHSIFFTSFFPPTCYENISFWMNSVEDKILPAGYTENCEESEILFYLQA